MRMIAITAMLLMFSGVFQSYAADVSPPEPINLRGTYHVYFGGIPVAKLWMAFEQDDKTYRYTCAIKSKGIARLFKRIRALTTSHGVKTDHGWQTLALTIHSEYPDGNKETKLAYDEEGNLKERVLSDDDDPNYRPRIDKERLRSVPTYGNAFQVLRDAIYNSLKSGEKQFKTEIYDAKRLMRVTAVIEGEQNYQVKGRYVTVYRLRFSRELLEGFTEKEKKRYAEGEPPLMLYVAKENLLPIALEIGFTFGSIKAYWVSDADAAKGDTH